MAEVQLQIIVYGTNDTLESMELHFPIGMTIVTSISSLDYKVNYRSKSMDSKLKRYFVLILESIEDTDNFSRRMEENPQVISVFHLSSREFKTTFKSTKIYSIDQELLSIAVTFNIIHFLTNEADKQVTANQISLSKIYLREAEKIKEWLMSTIRAEPCHILVIPLNTTRTNLMESRQHIQQICAKLGYPSAIIHSMDDYIPKSAIFNKLPYGKVLFEHEDPTLICRWLRSLSPIRMYLYGNEQIIPNAWSEMMIANEVDRSNERTFNDDDWYTFIENESIRDDIKWNFSFKYARAWKITQFIPIHLDTLGDNIRFRSALRRSNITFDKRRSDTTAKIFEWFDDSLRMGYIQREFKLNRQDQPNSLPDVKGGDGLYKRSREAIQIPDINFSSTTDDKNKYSYSLTYSPNRSNELVNYYSSEPDCLYIWLDDYLYSIEQRFQTIISPYQWRYFFDVDDCRTFILRQQLQLNNPRIYLCSTYSLARQLFVNEYVPKIDAAYLYSNQNELFPKWINSFTMIRGIFNDFDQLFQQLCSDISTSTELVSFSPIQQKTNDRSWISLLDSDGDALQRRRFILEYLVKLSSDGEAKLDMIQALCGASSENGIMLRQIEEFSSNYHSNVAILYYTRDTFLYRLINRTLAENNRELIMKYRLFIIDLYRQLSELHQQIIRSDHYSEQTVLTYYRGQSMSLSDIDQYKQRIGSYISINAFLSTSASLSIALMFAGESIMEDTMVYKPVILCIEVDPSIKNTQPYAHINSYSVHEDEDEVLFSFGTVFRIEKLSWISSNEDIQVIHLKMIDERDLPQEWGFNNPSTSMYNILNTPYPVYAIVGLTSLFQENEDIKTLLENVDVRFFDNMDDVDHYVNFLETFPSFVIFIHNQFSIPERYQQTKVILYDENEMHFNDLIYQLLSEMEKNPTLQERIRDLYTDVANFYHLSNERNCYIQLLLSSTSKKESEEQLKTRFASLSSIPFYQTTSCIKFLQSITEPSKIGDAILILYCDDSDLETLIDRFEHIYSIKYMYICSKHAFNIKPRRIIHGKFQNENDLYTQLYSDNLLNSFIQTNQEIDVNKNKTEATRYLQQTEDFYKLLKDHQNKLVHY